jgi:hypothetical protein
LKVLSEGHAEKSGVSGMLSSSEQKGSSERAAFLSFLGCGWRFGVCSLSVEL